jgi:hypothetical protein
MNDRTPSRDNDRPVLPHDAFRNRRSGAVQSGNSLARPVVVTPDYEDKVQGVLPPSGTTAIPDPQTEIGASSRNPFAAYGARAATRPYALRLPDRIDFVVRQLAAEERTHPLRVIDRALHDYLARIGRLPPANNP